MKIPKRAWVFFTTTDGPLLFESRKKAMSALAIWRRDFGRERTDDDTKGPYEYRLSSTASTMNRRGK